MTWWRPDIGGYDYMRGDHARWDRLALAEGLGHALRAARLAPPAAVLVTGHPVIPAVLAAIGHPCLLLDDNEAQLAAVASDLPGPRYAGVLRDQANGRALARLHGALRSMRLPPAFRAFAAAVTRLDEDVAPLLALLGPEGVVLWIGDDPPAPGSYRLTVAGEALALVAEAAPPA